MILIGIGIALVVYGLTGYVPRPAAGRSAFSSESRLMLMLGAGLVAIGWVIREDKGKP